MAIISRNNSTLHINFPKTIKNNVSDCDAIYIGKTKRTLTKRLNTCNTRKIQIAALVQHIEEFYLTINWFETNIIVCEQDHAKRLFLNSWVINKIT